MRIVLLQDVKSLGKVGTFVGISEGCAHNFLLSKKLGAVATAKNLNTLKLKQANETKIAAEQSAEARAFTVRIEAGSVTVHIKGSRNGRTYSSILIKELTEAVKEQLSLELDKKEIALAELIKNFGSYETVIKLHRDMQAMLRVNATEAK